MKSEGVIGVILIFARGFVASLVLGVFGGMICGSAILSLCALSGRIQTTGENYIGYWHYGLVLVGSMYGAAFGAIAGPVAYASFVRAIGFKRSIGPAMLGTIACGYAGSIYTPILGPVTGIAGFFLALFIVRFMNSSQSKRADAPLT